jgi:peptide/nickel transport system permease protein
MTRSISNIGVISRACCKGIWALACNPSKRSSEAILVRLPNTIILSTSSILLAIIIGLPLGVISAVKQNTWIDNSSQVAALAGVSVPNFWLGIVFIIVFGVMLRWLPVGGMAENPFSWEGIRHLILPSFSLGAGTAALVARMTRSSVLEVIRKDYVRTARAKGVPDSKVLLVHTLRNALIPVLTIIGVSFGVLLGGAIITEQVFSINGIGRLLIQAISQRDFPMVQGCVLNHRGHIRNHQPDRGHPLHRGGPAHQLSKRKVVFMSAHAVSQTGFRAPFRVQKAMAGGLAQA